MSTKRSPNLATKDDKPKSKEQSQQQDEDILEFKGNGEQTLPNWMHVFSQKELEMLSTYKHSTSKTSLDHWFINGPTGFLERMWPSFFSANSLTLMGQFPVLLMLFYVFYTQGTNLSPDDLIDRKSLLACGFVIAWFS